MHIKKSLVALTALLSLSACFETTSTQRGYTSARDECREMAEAKTEAQARNMAPNSQDFKKELLINFSECMGSRGWAVTGPDKNKPDDLLDISTVPAAVAVSPLAPPAINADDLRMKRAAECSYARQAQYHSANARAMARACDADCRTQRSTTPGAPLPAACAP